MSSPVILENSQSRGRKWALEKRTLDLVREKGSDEIIFVSPWGSSDAQLQVRVTQEYADGEH